MLRNIINMVLSVLYCLQHGYKSYGDSVKLDKVAGSSLVRTLSQQDLTPGGSETHLNVFQNSMTQTVGHPA